MILRLGDSLKKTVLILFGEKMYNDWLSGASISHYLRIHENTLSEILYS